MTRGFLPLSNSSDRIRKCDCRSKSRSKTAVSEFLRCKKTTASHGLTHLVYTSSCENTTPRAWKRTHFLAARGDDATSRSWPAPRRSDVVIEWIWNIDDPIVMARTVSVGIRSFVWMRWRLFGAGIRPINMHRYDHIRGDNVPHACSIRSAYAHIGTWSNFKFRRNVFRDKRYKCGWFEEVFNQSRDARFINGARLDWHLWSIELSLVGAVESVNVMYRHVAFIEYWCYI